KSPPPTGAGRVPTVGVVMFSAPSAPVEPLGNDCAARFAATRRVSRAATRKELVGRLAPRLRRDFCIESSLPAQGRTCHENLVENAHRGCREVARRAKI